MNCLLSGLYFEHLSKQTCFQWLMWTTHFDRLAPKSDLGNEGSGHRLRISSHFLVLPSRGRGTYNFKKMASIQSPSTTKMFLNLRVPIQCRKDGCFISGVCLFSCNFDIFQWRTNKLVVHATRITWFYNEKSMWNERAPFVKKLMMCARQQNFSKTSTPLKLVMWETQRFCLRLLCN